jgi:hypothetical protein
MVKDWSRALPLLLLLALLLPLLLPALLPEIHALFIVGVDVWTDKGGHGFMNINGGRYNIGESITVFCSESFPDADSLRIRAIRYAFFTNELTLLERGSPPAGTYQASYSVRDVGMWVGMWKAICEVRSGGESFSDEVLFGVPYPSPLGIDVWTNKGGQGSENPDGGQYTIGESITIYCEVAARASVLVIKLLRPDGSEVVVLNRGDVQTGTYSVAGTVGEPTGIWIVMCWALFDDFVVADHIGFNVRQGGQGATATVTIYTTTTRTVTSTLHATATTETTTYITVYQTTSSTSTRTWYTTVTRTATTTVISWTTVTTTVLG